MDIEAGAVFLPIGPWLARAELGETARGLSLEWRAGLAAHGPHADRVSETLATWTGRSLRPWSPAHLRWRAEGDELKLDWVRRTRIGGDDWSVQEVPVDETPVRYRVEIRSGPLVVRAAETDREGWTYPSAARSADLAAQSELSVHVAQLSPVRGPGAFSALTVPDTGF